MSKTVLILGVNGFIGSALSKGILDQTDWHMVGIDLADDKLGDMIHNDRFEFKKGDVLKESAWVEDKIKSCDVVLPLVAIASPALYVSDPLKVFSLDFESNLDIVKLCVKHKKRIIFPSTSEVYGMCPDDEFCEETSNLVLGPIHKQRWIYSCSKQMLDRVIYAHGVHNDLDYTLFRPFNWLGWGLDSLSAGKAGQARVVTQFLADILYKQELHLVDDGVQSRSFTDIDDGIGALLKIIENKDNCATKRIFNIGNPKNDVTIKDLSQMVLDIVKSNPKFEKIAESVKIHNTPSKTLYGAHYQDVSRRVPSISAAKDHLHWEPSIDLKTSLEKAITHHLSNFS